MDTLAFVLYIFALVLAVIATFNVPARINLLAGAFAFFVGGVLASSWPIS